MKKEFEVPKRDGTKAKFIFSKNEWDKSGIWYWDLPDGKSLPLPDMELEKTKELKEILDLIGKQRSQEWVGQVIVDLLRVVEYETKR